MKLAVHPWGGPTHETRPVPTTLNWHLNREYDDLKTLGIWLCSNTPPYEFSIKKTLIKLAINVNTNR